MVGLIIPADLMEQVLAHCRECYPHEACGLLAGRDDRVEKVFCLINADSSPVSYHLDPAEQFRVMKEMRRDGQRMAGIFHSHPQSPPYPSARDVSLAFYSDAVYVIVGMLDRDRPEVRAFEIVDGRVSEVHLKAG
jgi:proteasome lid subunit RPN8/RPN11